MLDVSPSFDTYNDLDYHAPMYLIHFENESIDYCNHIPLSPTNTCKQYLKKVSGLSQKVQPEEGKASVSSIKAEIINNNSEITALLSTDVNSRFQRRKATLKIGFVGMTEADMYSINGRVTDINYNANNNSYIFDITDPQKYLQRKIFRGATDESGVTIQGNPLNLVLQIMTASGTSGTNGTYDWYAAANGLNMVEEDINITTIEKIRDDWYPGDSHYMQFYITERIVAREWLSKEIFIPLNIYPIIDGQGRFSLLRYSSPLGISDEAQSFDEDSILDIPKLDLNFQGLINEIEVFADYDGEDFLINDFYQDGTSINNRGSGKKTPKIESKGIKSTYGDSSIIDKTSILERRVDAYFARYSPPPLKIDFSTKFNKIKTEAGDIVSFTHNLLPDIEAGIAGLTNERMEVINKTPNWDSGKVKFTLLGTQFDRKLYGAIAPNMYVTGVTDQSNFTVSSTDAIKYSSFVSPVVNVYDSGMRLKSSGVTIDSISSAGTITSSVTNIIHTDDCSSDNTADWDDSESGVTLTFDTDHYEIETNASSKQILVPNLDLIKNKKVKISAQFKDGTEAGATLQFKIQDGGTIYGGPAIVTTGSWIEHDFVTTIATETSIGKAIIFIITDLTGNNIEMKDFVFEKSPIVATDIIGFADYEAQIAAQQNYGVIGRTGAITAQISTSEFGMSTADINKFTVDESIEINDSALRIQESGVTIASISGNIITLGSDLDVSPAIGWVIQSREHGLISA